MKEETVKEKTLRVARAIFLGTFFMIAVALLVMPELWWIGLFAGIAVGCVISYLGYDPKRVSDKIPRALELTKEGFKEDYYDFKKWLREPQPMLLLYLFSVVMNIFLYLCLVTLIMACTNPGTKTLSYWFSELGRALYDEGPIAGIIALIALLVVSVYFAFVKDTDNNRTIALNLVCRGMPKKGIYFMPEHTINSPALCEYYFIGLLSLVSTIVWFFVWKVWYGLAIGIYYTTRFLWYLCKLVHCREKVICVIDTLVCGLATIYMALQLPLPLPMSQVVFIAFCGASAGAVFGVVNYLVVAELLMKKILRVQLNPVKF